MLQVGFDASGGDLDADGPAAGAFPQHVHHGLQVLFGVDLREAAGALHLLAGLLAPEGGDLRRHLFPGQMAAHAGLGALADLDLDGVGGLQVLVGDAVFVGDVFEDVLIGRGLLLGQDAAFAAAHGSARLRAALGQGYFYLPGQGAEGHVRDVDRAFQHHGLFGVLADDGAGIHGLAVQQRRGIELGPQQQDVVPAGHGHQGAHGGVDDLAGNCHFMDLRHIAGALVLPGEAGVVGQGAGGHRRGGLRCGGVVGYLFEFVQRLLADGAGAELGKGLALFFLVVDVTADSALVNRHDDASSLS